MKDKISLRIRLDEPKATSNFANELKSEEEKSKFMIVPKGGAGLNLEPETMAVLVAFFENGGSEFLRFFVDKVIQFFQRKETLRFEIQVDDRPPVTIYSNMSEDTVKELSLKALGMLNDRK